MGHPPKKYLKNISQRINLLKIFVNSIWESKTNSIIQIINTI